MFTAPHAFVLLGATLVGSTFLILGPAAPLTIPFDEAEIFVEYNATDEDAEVVVSVDADMGLGRFRIVNPLGKQILDLRSKHTKDIGTRKIDLETPEPSLGTVLAAYPEGRYLFLGKSTNGVSLLSEVWLTHDLPAAPEITYPLDGATGVPLDGASATWTAGPDADSFFVELEQEELGEDIQSNCAGDTSSFGFPAGWLEPLTEYQLGVGARAENGNLTVVEIHFTTGR